MIIDSHQHVILPSEKQLSMMSETGIEKTILFSTTVHPEIAFDLDSFEKEMGILNEIISGKRNPLDARIKSIKEQVKVIAENPTKFIGFGSVQLGLSQEQTACWIEDNIIANKFRGLGEFTLTSGQMHLLEPVFAADVEFGYLPLWIHTFSPLTLDDIKSIAALAKKYPKTPVILGHLGGANWLETIKLAKEIRNLYLDLSGTFSILVVSLAIKEIPERTLFSSDAPYGDPLLARETIERVTNDNYVKDRILGENIAQLLCL
ncbi:putative TIM-barrel fold metal-dependent hydrolase [Desulfosporosinus acidiphilus SJ4]|uniref:Putative TIM-barrel fold metal-dependent hydrolase n=1 Tax=Desulfosporosinus acidiphilus (strain DSM 22704 / JCM 16185 / SJ4) TaxID=646529 RepID=I4D232_DESAJ|nr:amidohydrolase family protein [Desulfosporosinus acidiphilus]AFM39856.1 putative TIM-barrel fold metal-dependent hydrolase [Desulfosporosinus acidiphilus SJ4]